MESPTRKNKIPWWRHGYGNLSDKISFLLSEITCHVFIKYVYINLVKNPLLKWNLSHNSSFSNNNVTFFTMKEIITSLWLVVGIIECNGIMIKLPKKDRLATFQWVMKSSYVYFPYLGKIFNTTMSNQNSASSKCYIWNTKLIENIASSIHKPLDISIATYREISLIKVLIPLQRSDATCKGALLR